MWGAYLFAGISIAYCAFVLWYLCPFRSKYRAIPKADRLKGTDYDHTPDKPVAKVPSRWEAVLSKPHEVQDNSPKSS